MPITNLYIKRSPRHSLISAWRNNGAVLNDISQEEALNTFFFELDSLSISASSIFDYLLIMVGTTLTTGPLKPFVGYSLGEATVNNLDNTFYNPNLGLRPDTTGRYLVIPISPSSRNPASGGLLLVADDLDNGNKEYCGTRAGDGWFQLGGASTSYGGQWHVSANSSITSVNKTARPEHDDAILISSSIASNSFSIFWNETKGTVNTTEKTASSSVNNMNIFRAGTNTTGNAFRLNMFGVLSRGLSDTECSNLTMAIQKLRSRMNWPRTIITPYF